MNELQNVTDIDEVIKYAEREAEGCHQMASAYHTDEGVYLREETRFQYKAILWENIHEWLEELKELREKQRPHGEWIPCSERLPEEGQKIYLVTIDYGNGLSCVAPRFFWDEKRLWNEAEEYITAWMLCPEPYKREGGENG